MRAQRVFVIQRVKDGMFCKNLRSPVWTEDVGEADFLSATKFKGIVLADWGRDMCDYRLCEVKPSMIEITTAQKEGGE